MLQHCNIWLLIYIILERNVEDEEDELMARARRDLEAVSDEEQTQ